jgi:hypothetical protein
MSARTLTVAVALGLLLAGCDKHDHEGAIEKRSWWR